MLLVFSTLDFSLHHGARGVLRNRQAGLVWYRAGASTDGDQSVFRGEAKTRSGPLGPFSKKVLQCYPFIRADIPEIYGIWGSWFCFCCLFLFKGWISDETSLEYVSFVLFDLYIHVLRPWVDSGRTARRDIVQNAPKDFCHSFAIISSQFFHGLWEATLPTVPSCSSWFPSIFQHFLAFSSFLCPWLIKELRCTLDEKLLCDPVVSPSF